MEQLLTRPTHELTNGKAVLPVVETDQHLVSAYQVERNWLERRFFPLIQHIEYLNGADRSALRVLNNRRIEIVHEEPSTRTVTSMFFAGKALGADVDKTSSVGMSLEKAETRYDTRLVYEALGVELLGWRTKTEGAINEIATPDAKLAVINLGDGPGEHPTQFLQNIAVINETLQKRGKTPDDAHIAIVGHPDSRVARSDLRGIAKCYPGANIYLVSHKELGLPQEDLDDLEDHGLQVTVTDDILGVAQIADVIEMTRYQGNHDPRFGYMAEYGDRVKRAKDYYDLPKYWINNELMAALNPEAIILHPLPRNDEIPFEFTKHPQILAFTRQMEMGLFSRMALMVDKLAPEVADSWSEHGNTTHFGELTLGNNNYYSH